MDDDAREAWSGELARDFIITHEPSIVELPETMLK